MTDKELETVELVYCGHRPTRTAGEVGELWATVAEVERWIEDDSGQWLGTVENLKAGLFKASRSEPLIGGIYEVKALMKDGKPVRLSNNFKFVRKMTVPRLYAASKAVDTTIAAERKLKDIKADNQLFGELRRLKALYRAASPENRLALEVLVLKALRYGV